LRLQHGHGVVSSGGAGLPSAAEIDAQLAELSATLPKITYKTTNPRAPATAPKVLPAHVVFDKKVGCQARLPCSILALSCSPCPLFVSRAGDGSGEGHVDEPLSGEAVEKRWGFLRFALISQVLCFDGYFKQTIHESPLEHYRVRYVKVGLCVRVVGGCGVGWWGGGVVGWLGGWVVGWLGGWVGGWLLPDGSCSPASRPRLIGLQIYYYLEDDTISVLEPEVPNSGMPQGKLIKRQRLPKDELGNTWHWKVRWCGLRSSFPELFSP
jgi:hypothetical protein